MKSGIRIIRAMMRKQDTPKDPSLQRLLEPDMQSLLDAYESRTRQFIREYMLAYDPTGEFADMLDDQTR